MTIKKRGYSREFTPRTGKRYRYLLDDIPPTLWEDAKRKADREGLSMRAILLTLLTAWTKASRGDYLEQVAGDVAVKTGEAALEKADPIVAMLRQHQRAIDHLSAQLDAVATAGGKATVETVRQRLRETNPVTEMERE